MRDDATRRTENIGTGLIVVATGFSALAVLAFQAIGSRSLGADAFAPIAVLWTVMFLVYTILNLPAEQHLTRALVVTKDAADLSRVRRDMLGAFGLGTVLGTVFVAATLNRFFDGDIRFVAITAGIMVTRSIMAIGRGSLAGHRRFGAYGASIALEAGALLSGGVLAAVLGFDAIGFTAVLVVAPLATLLARPFAPIEGHDPGPEVMAQPGSFLVWLVLATAASQLIIAGGPIAVGFLGGSAAAVSIYFTTFALLRGPVTSAYNLVARVLPDFTNLSRGDRGTELWRWPTRIAVSGVGLAGIGALGAGLVLPTIIEVVYGTEFVPPTLAAVFGGAGVGLGLAALFATQVYSAAAMGRRLTLGWGIGLAAAIVVLVVSGLEPVERVALAFVVGEATALAMLGVALVPRLRRSAV